MRFSLFTLLTVVALLAVCLAMLMEHGLFGIWLLVPHVAIVATVVRLARSRRRKLVAICTSVYLGLWVLTFLIGVKAVRDDVQSELAQNRPANLVALKLLNYDPMLEDSMPSVQPPWLFVGNGNVPCPLVVTVEYGGMYGYLNGSGGRLYFVWFFGHKLYLKDQWSWIS